MGRVTIVIPHPFHEDGVLSVPWLRIISSELLIQLGVSLRHRMLPYYLDDNYPLENYVLDSEETGGK